jgi:hypothetical protein
MERQKTTLLILKVSKESNSLAKFYAHIFFLFYEISLFQQSMKRDVCYDNYTCKKIELF